MKVCTHLTAYEKELLLTFAKIHGLSVEEALKKAAKDGLKARFGMTEAEIKVFKKGGNV